MSSTKTWMISFAGLAVLATLAVAQGRGERREGRHAEGRAEARAGHADARVADRGEHTGGDFGRGHRGRFERARRFVRGLDLTEQQRELARDEARAIAPRAQAYRDEARAIVERERGAGRDDAARARAREELRGLRDRARAELAPHGRALVDSLTPEQRSRIEARLALRGRTFDADRASERVARWLARPRVQERAREGRERTR